VTGLAAGNSIVIQNNGIDSLTLASNSSFIFSTPLVSGTPYNVTISTQPAYQGCTVITGSGTVANSNVSNVGVHCPQVETLWNFGIGTDGTYPQSGLILATDGNFYGTTEFGGQNLWGAVDVPPLLSSSWV
jgi:hypothetical protein